LTFLKSEYFIGMPGAKLKWKGRSALEKFISWELLAKVTYSVIPAKAGIQNCFKSWIPGRASLARNDNFLLFPRVLKEAHGRR